MALQTGLRHPERLAGLVVLSSFLPLADKVAAEASAANRDVPIFMAHGTHDPLIPLSRGHESRDLLLGQGYRIEWHEYRMPHSVCAEEIADLSAWLRGTLGSP
jgi:phospholipase/carboxylesterase